MALKTYKPATPGLRQLVLVDREGVWKGKPLKALTVGKIGTGARNNLGRVTVRFRGGGHKRALRLVDFKRLKRDVPATVERIEYDPNRTALLALVKYSDGERSYILAPQRLAPGDSVVAGESVDVKPGNAMPLENIPVGTQIHNIELKPGHGGQMVRSAGSSAQLMAREGAMAQVRLPSGETRMVMADCMATIGQVGNAEHELIQLGKAGRKRWLGKKSHQRGVSMNPIDHPHGGGEGRTSGGRHPVTPWGKPTKGHKTRHNKRTDNLIVRSRNAKG